LITGANGHLGQRMIARLATHVTVTALVRSEHAAGLVRKALENKPYSTNVSIRVHDYTDLKKLAESLNGCRSVIHLVGIIKESANSTYVQAQEDTTQALVSAATSAGIERIVYVSIAGADRTSNNACLASKGRAEDILLNSLIPSLILRIPMVLGQGDYATAALERRAQSRLVMLLRGASLEQPIYAPDVEEALLKGVSCDLVDSTILELAGPESLSRRNLTLRAARVLGKTPLIVSLPYFLGATMAGLLEKLSNSPPVTRAMLGVLDHDDQVDPMPAREWLGIELTPLDVMLKVLISP